jgi:hypothetical protein
MPSTTRRRLLRLAGTALASGVAGCAGGGRQSRLGDLAVTNYDARPHHVHVLVLEDDDPAYWASTRVPAAEGDVLGTATFEGYPTDVTSHRLYARLDGEPLAASERFEFAAHDADCIGVQIEIGDDRRPPELSIWYTTSTDRCTEG